MATTEARGAVFRFEELLQRNIERHAPEVTEIWVRWVGSGSEDRGRDVPDVHFVGQIEPAVMQRCAMIADESAKLDPGVTRLGHTSFHQQGQRSPGELRSKPALVWRRLVQLLH